MVLENIGFAIRIYSPARFFILSDLLKKELKAVRFALIKLSIHVWNNTN